MRKREDILPLFDKGFNDSLSSEREASAGAGIATSRQEIEHQKSEVSE